MSCDGCCNMFFLLSLILIPWFMYTFFDEFYTPFIYPTFMFGPLKQAFHDKLKLLF